MFCLKFLLIIIFILVLYSYYTISIKTELFYNLNIKKINIIQTWKNNKIPDKYVPLVSKIKNLQNINYIFFSDSDIDQFIKKYYQYYYQLYNSFKYKIQKIDFFRYLAIYHYGGIYLDLDILLLKTFDSLDLNKCTFPIEFDKSSDTILHEQNFYKLIGNYAFYSPKGHPFLKLIINNIYNHKLDKFYNDYRQYIYYTTGPVLVTQSYIDFKQKDQINLIYPTPFKKGYFGEYAKHLQMGSWK